MVIDTLLIVGMIPINQNRILLWEQMINVLIDIFLITYVMLGVAFIWYEDVIKWI